MSSFTTQITKRRQLSDWIRGIIKRIEKAIPEKYLQEMKGGTPQYYVLVHPTEEADMILKLTWHNKNGLIIEIITPLNTLMEIDDEKREKD